MIATFTGVEVSSRAKNPGARALISTYAGIPRENAHKAAAVASVASIPNFPR